jgi:hypothetical protein
MVKVEKTKKGLKITYKKPKKKVKKPKKKVKTKVVIKKHKPKKKKVVKKAPKSFAKKVVLTAPGAGKLRSLIGAMVGAKKRPASGWSFSDIVDKEMIQEGVENVEEDGFNNGDIDWIDGVSEKEERYFNVFLGYERRRKMTSKQEDKWHRILDKVERNLRPSLIKNIKEGWREWKRTNKDGLMTQKQAIKSFRIHQGYRAEPRPEKYL